MREELRAQKNFKDDKHKAHCRNQEKNNTRSFLEAAKDTFNKVQEKSDSLFINAKDGLIDSFSNFKHFFNKDTTKFSYAVEIDNKQPVIVNAMNVIMSVKSAVCQIFQMELIDLVTDIAYVAGIMISDSEHIPINFYIKLLTILCTMLKWILIIFAPIPSIFVSAIVGVIYLCGTLALKYLTIRYELIEAEIIDPGKVDKIFDPRMQDNDFPLLKQSIVVPVKFSRTEYLAINTPFKDLILSSAEVTHEHETAVDISLALELMNPKNTSTMFSAEIVTQRIHNSTNLISGISYNRFRQMDSDILNNTAHMATVMALSTRTDKLHVVGSHFRLLDEKLVDRPCINNFTKDPVVIQDTISTVTDPAKSYFLKQKRSMKQKLKRARDYVTSIMTSGSQWVIAESKPLKLCVQNQIRTIKKHLCMESLKEWLQESLDLIKVSEEDFVIL
jgi:hypothetical protein